VSPDNTACDKKVEIHRQASSAGLDRTYILPTTTAFVAIYVIYYAVQFRR